MHIYTYSYYVMYVANYLQIVIKAQQCKLVLQVHSEIDALGRMNHNVDEIHAGHLKVSAGLPVHENLHQLLKSMSLVVLLLEVVHCFHYLGVATLYQTDCCQ